MAIGGMVVGFCHNYLSRLVMTEMITASSRLELLKHHLT